MIDPNRIALMYVRLPDILSALATSTSSRAPLYHYLKKLRKGSKQFDILPLKYCSVAINTSCTLCSYLRVSSFTLPFVPGLPLCVLRSSFIQLNTLLQKMAPFPTNNLYQVSEYLAKKGYSRTEAMFRTESPNQDAEGRPNITRAEDADLKYGRAFRERPILPHRYCI